MKIILIILTAIQLIGIISSSYLSKSFIAGIAENIWGIVTIGVLWAIYLGYKAYKRSKSGEKILEENK